MLKSIWLAKNIVTSELVFIQWGERYDQQVYQLMFTLGPEQVLKMNDAYQSSYHIKSSEVAHKLPKYGDLITREEYEEFGWSYDACYPSDGKVYWHIDPEFKDSSHVLCLSK